PWAVLASAICAALGSLVAARLARSDLRTPTFWLLAAAAAALALGATTLLVEVELFARLLGPSRALAIGEAVRWGGLALCASAVLRVLCLRHPTLAAIEVAVCGAVISVALAGHRHGAINRPMELADLVFTRGGDPTVWILGLGGIGAFGMAVLLVS